MNVKGDREKGSPGEGEGEGEVMKEGNPDNLE